MFQASQAYRKPPCCALSARGEGLLHCCARSGSAEVLRAILSLILSQNASTSLDSLICSRDFSETTPLGAAIATKHWGCVRILCAYGALHHNATFIDTKTMLGAAVHERPTVRDNPGGTGMISLYNSVSVFFTDILGASKLRELEKRLEGAGKLGVTGNTVGMRCGADELGEVLDCSVKHLASTLNLEQPEASALLVAYNYNEGVAIQAFVDDPRGET